MLGKRNRKSKTEFNEFDSFIFSIEENTPRQTWRRGQMKFRVREARETVKAAPWPLQYEPLQ
jgi:hypothetical protein